MSKSEEGQKTSRLYVRCYPYEAAYIREKAGICGLSVSQYLVQCALQKKIYTKTDHKMIATLNKLAGLQKHLFYQGGSAEHYTTVVDDIRETLQFIREGEVI